MQQSSESYYFYKTNFPNQEKKKPNSTWNFFELMNLAMKMETSESEWKANKEKAAERIRRLLKRQEELAQSAVVPTISTSQAMSVSRISSSRSCYSFSTQKTQH
jgi:hypothetical protein